MPPEQELRVRLEPQIRKRLDVFRRTDRRTLTGAVNLLLEEALDARNVRPGTEFGQ